MISMMLKRIPNNTILWLFGFNPLTLLLGYVIICIVGASEYVEEESDIFDYSYDFICISRASRDNIDQDFGYDYE